MADRFILIALPQGTTDSIQISIRHRSREDNMTARLRRFAGRAPLAAAVLMLAAPAYADGMRGSLKDTPKPEERCKHSANVALTTNYIFRGISQTKEGPAIQGGYDLTCGIFYAG